MSAAAAPKTMTPDWANLHEELLAHTAKKLTNPIHFVRFRAVCRRWRSAARPADLPPQTPWLLLAQFEEGGNTATSFFCPLSKERFSLNLPSAISPQSLLGSSRGWLVLCEPGSLRSWSMHISLLNPLTASRIHLPPLHHQFGRLPLNPRAASLSSDPAARRCIVMVTFPCTFPCMQEFVFCRLGDASWTRVNAGFGPPMQEAASAYHKGSFYVVDGYGRAAIYGMSLTDEDMRISTVGGPFTECHLVESDDGEQLFLVTKKNKKTEVFELDESAAWPVWSKIDGIGGNAMFLSDHSCCCVKPSDFSSCRKNTLYFAYNHSEHTYLDVQGVGVPGLDDGDTDIFRHHPHPPWACWYTPIIR